jgi:hypothetical protein
MRNLLLSAALACAGFIAAAAAESWALGQERAAIGSKVPLYDASPPDLKFGGLRIIKNGVRIYRVGDVEKLVVAGWIFNAGEVPLKVPDVHMELRDDAKTLVRETRQTFATTPLESGKAIGFEIAMEIPSLVDRLDFKERLAKGGYSYGVSLDP